MMSRLGNIGGRLYRGEVSVEFVGRKRLWYAISGLILVISVAALLTRGLNYTVDFKGGSVFQFTAPSTSVSQVRATVKGAGAPDDPIVQSVSGGKWQVQTEPMSNAGRTKVQDAIATEYHLNANKDVSVQFVGPTWGSEISKKAAEALIAFLIAIVLYLSVAFEWRMALAALVALAHDIVIAVGIYALAGFEVSPATVIGLLTILGYSLYDTVVVFDKVRENTAGLLGSARSNYSQAANLALNQTLVRSINTSVIALLPVAAILFVGAGLLGAGELKDLALVLFVGMLSGTYSSIFIATPVLASLKEREPQYKALARRVATREAGGGGKRAARRAARATAGAASRNGGGAIGSGDLALDAGAAESDDVPDAGGADGGTPDAGAPAAGAAAGAPATGAGAPAAGGGASQRGAGAAARGGQGRPRQQPSRSSAARRRPSGKSKSKRKKR
jgi:preprotein translocase subunit SecF